MLGATDLRKLEFHNNEEEISLELKHDSDSLKVQQSIRSYFQTTCKRTSDKPVTDCIDNANKKPKLEEPCSSNSLTSSNKQLEKITPPVSQLQFLN